MIFNSIEFALFLPIVFLLYWFPLNKNLKLQNLFLLFASYFFYGWWDWRFLSLIVFSSTIDFFIGLKLGKEEEEYRRKVLIIFSLFVNLGLLSVFKYYNFFIDSFANAFTLFGKSFAAPRLNLVLPIGISFYTFQTLSYSIDVFRKKLRPTNNYIYFLAFVSFFPQLVAGPIERATNLLPQFFENRIFTYKKGIEGMRQILWGLFKKMIIADTCALYVDQIFNSYQDQSGFTLLIGAVLFSFQIYGDFSGYSDIAIGTAKLFGFNLMQNFAFPYFSRDIAEFWRRWHISLSSWFRDYLYIPLGGSRVGNIKKIRNIFAIFLVSGFWHGANWTFIFWGFLHACYYLPIMLLGKNRINLDVLSSSGLIINAKNFLHVVSTFFLVTIAWVFFRANTIMDALNYLYYMFSKFNFSLSIQIPYYLYIEILFLLIIEWIFRHQKYALENLSDYAPRSFRILFYFVLTFAIYFLQGQQQQFIYFQF